MTQVEGFTDLDTRALGTRLRARREALGLHQAQVAWRAAMDIRLVVALEAGANVRPSINTLYKLCKVLRVSADELLGLEP